MKLNCGKLIKEKLGILLEEYGFIETNDGKIYVRKIDGLLQGILVKKNRYKNEFVVIASIAPIPVCHNESLFNVSSEDINKLEAAIAKFQLSPVAPFRNSYSWSFDSEGSVNKAIDEITYLVDTLCLPIFSSIISIDKLYQSQDDNFIIKIVQDVNFLLHQRIRVLGYELSDRHLFVWRKIDDIYVILLPSVLGFGCFISVYMILWSPLLHGWNAFSGEPPSDFTTVAFREIERQGIPGADRLVWFIGNEIDKINAIDQLEVVVSTIVEQWLCSHHSLCDLIELVHPELRATIQMKIQHAIDGVS